MLVKEIGPEDRELSDVLFNGVVSLDRMKNYIKTVVPIAISGPDVLAVYESNPDLATCISSSGIWHLHKKGKKLFATYSFYKPFDDKVHGFPFVRGFSSEPGSEFLPTEHVADVYAAIPVLIKGLQTLLGDSADLRQTDWKHVIAATRK